MAASLRLEGTLAELEILGSNRILAGSRADLTVACYRDGELATPSGTLTFSVANAEGTVLATGTPTASSGILAATMTAAQNADVNTLTVTWGGLVFDAEPAISLTSEHESVGAWLFGLAEARTFGNPTQPLASESAYPDDYIRTYRALIADKFAERLRYPLGRRYQIATVDGEGTAELFLPEAWRCYRLRAAWTRTYGETTWTALTESELALAFLTKHGIIEREGAVWPRGRQNIKVAYENGAQPIPIELRDAALSVLVASVVGNDTPERATAQSIDGNVFTLATPGIRGSFVGIPGVDEALEHHRVKTFGVA